MSKKNKKKLEKRLIAERLRMLEAESKETKVKKPAFETSETKPAARNEEKKLNQKDQLILGDIKRVGVVALIMLAIFIALFLLKSKTGYLVKASDEILNFLHIGQF